MSARHRFQLTAPVVPEHAIQKQIADVLRLEIAPAGKVSKAGVVWYSVDVSNYAGEVPGIRVGRGIIAGIPDLIILHRGRAFHIEIKTTEGELSDHQQALATAILIAGGQVGVARDASEVLALLDEWGIPRARRVREAA